MKVMVRLFLGGKLEGEPRLLDDAGVTELIRNVLLQYKDSPHMIEFEFPDAPADEAFLRIGTDPQCMVDPRAIHMKHIIKMLNES